jgi:L-lactate dehydrogenase complex protein LldF
MAQFRQRIRTSLANQPLQKALDLNAERRVTRRVNALETLPDWRERRQRAHAVRAEAIEHLDTYLDQFIANAEANGVTVHRAGDAAEAVQLVLQISKYLPQRTQSAQREKARSFVHLANLRGKEILIAKSKSMVTEEINLNHALEAEGMRVVETDLGEFIVQLRGERPSHIITPALHLQKKDVSELFRDKLGIEYTEDIQTLTNTARKVLREVFLTADVGITGANFAVAATGGICLVTNEGNGRMVTTLPPVHIALIGMERVVRDLDDLALMISLLPRSATGQKISVYTQIIHSPLEGQQRHFILLDNGRSRLRASPLKESLYCIRCGSCLNACPAFREIGGHAYKSVYGGPIGSVISAGLFGSEFVPLSQASSLCGACKEACPVDIDLPKLLVRVRAGDSPSPRGRGVRGEGTHGLSPFSLLSLKIYSRIAAHPRLFTLSQKFAALTSFIFSPRSNWMHLPAFTGWGYSKDFPRFAGKTFRDGWKDREADKGSDRQVNKNEEKSIQQEMDSSSPSAPQSGMELAERFTVELTAVHGHVQKTENPSQSIVEFLLARGIDRIHLERGMLDEDVLTKAGIAISHAPDPAIRVGVTKSICGLADTGSILEADGEGSLLHASLLPEIHLAVLYTSRIYPSLDNAIHLARNTKSAVFITGPSATGDIESTHTIGVHGPGEVHVFLVDD